MKESLRLGRVAGIPIGVHWSVLAIVILVAEGLAVVVLPELAPGRMAVAYWITALVTALVFVGSLLAHELAHALVARSFGVPVRRITLWLLGGVAQLGAEPPTPRADLLVAVCGPLTSLAVALLSFGASAAAQAVGLSELIVAAFGWLAVMNGLLAVFNLLPGAPLDGGRVLRALLWWRYGDLDQAEVRSARAGRLLGFVIAAAGFLEVLAGAATGIWLILVGWFIGVAAAQEARMVDLRVAVAGLRVEDVMTRDQAVGYGWMPVTAFIEQVATNTRQAVFPVIDLDGRPTGIVTLAGLARLPAERRASACLAEVQTPVSQHLLVEPGEPLTSLISRGIPAPPDDLVLVVANGHLVGVVSSNDVARALHLAAARRPARPDAGSSSR